MIQGILAFLTCLLVFAAGFFAGWKLCRALSVPPARPLTDPERTALLEEQKAFHLLQNYSAERAYGMQKGD
ncbi:MAG: hypothetical protein IJD04_06440 [Desulfovibrionaceae bacterium]|nr:hypothetical protein [Desulfovibrionaceae bacterium]